jgi:hypothetical protein
VLKPFLAGILVIVALLALILVPFFATKSDVLAQFTPLQGAARNVTQSEQTTVGPLPGDMARYESEQRCQEGLSTPGYLSAMNAAEQADAQRSNVYPCADFLGSQTEPNIVYTYKAEGYYPQIQYVNSGGPNALYLVGGTSTNSTGPVLPGPFIAKVNPISGEQVWRTYMENGNTENVFMGGTNLNILDNGNIIYAWNHKIALIDPHDGAILKMRNLPAPGEVTDRSINYKELTVAPDGTIILRSQNRPENCNQQGGGGLIACTDSAGGPEMKPSPMLAIDPDTLEIYDELVMPEDSATPTVIAPYEDKIAIYNAMTEHAYRVFWDPETRQLTLDPTWGPAYLADGQTVGDAPTYMGDWIVIQTNGVGSKTSASSLVAINVHDDTNIQRITPFGELESGQHSFAPPKPQGDLENNMVYSADGGVGKIAGIHLDPTTGKMTTKWVVDDTSFEFQPLFGTPENRIVVTSKHDPTADLQSLLTGTYTSSVVWRDAATGEVLAESDFLPPISFNSLITPIYGGRWAYVSGSAGALYFLQPMPASSQPPVATTVESSPSPTASATPSG